MYARELTCRMDDEGRAMVADGTSPGKVEWALDRRRG